MLLREKFNDFQLSVFKTRQCTSGRVFLPEGRAIGKRLNLTGNQVRNWFHNHRNELFEMPQVAPEIQKSIDNLLSEVKKEMGESESHTVRLKPPPTLPRRKYQNQVLETRFLQSSEISDLECHLISLRFPLEGRPIADWFSKRRSSKKEIDPDFVMCPKILEFLNDINREVEEQSRFEMTDSQEQYLKERLLIKTVWEEKERIAMSKIIGVPDYWIKFWFEKRNQADEQDPAETSSDCGKSTGSERISESLLASKPTDAEYLPNSKYSLDKMDYPKKKPKFTEFQLAFLKTRHCISGNISLREARTIGQQLNLNAKRVRSWFYNNKKKRFEVPQVEPGDQKAIDNLLIEVRKQLGESHSHVALLDPPPFSTKEYRLKILETRYRQGHEISGLESHLIGRHFHFDGEPIARWFKRRSHSKKEDDPNFVMCPKTLKLLNDINRQVDELSQFEMSDSQKTYLEERFSINTNLLKNERIAISEAIGVPDYFIKAWFKKRTKAERERHDHAALVPRLSGSSKDVESVSKCSSASVPSDTEAQSNSEDWFEKMATVTETSDMVLPDNPFSLPTSNEFTTSSDSTIYVPSTVPETQLSPRNTGISNIDESWGFHNDSVNSGVDFWSYTMSPTHELNEPWAPRNETASQEWGFGNHQMYHSSSMNNSQTSSEFFSSLPYPNQSSSIPCNAMDSTQPQPTQYWPQRTPDFSLQPYEMIPNQF